MEEICCAEGQSCLLRSPIQMAESLKLLNYFCFVMLMVLARCDVRTVTINYFCFVMLIVVARCDVRTTTIILLPFNL